MIAKPLSILVSFSQNHWQIDGIKESQVYIERERYRWSCGYICASMDPWIVQGRAVEDKATDSTISSDMPVFTSMVAQLLSKATVILMKDDVGEARKALTNRKPRVATSHVLADISSPGTSKQKTHHNTTDEHSLGKEFLSRALPSPVLATMASRRLALNLSTALRSRAALRAVQSAKRGFATPVVTGTTTESTTLANGLTVGQLIVFGRVSLLTTGIDRHRVLPVGADVDSWCVD
jgi:hypothetical protein